MTEKYRELRNENVKEINSRVRQFIHLKTGCELLFMENEDIEKVFTIVFRTPVENSSGIPHILEHSVLCGSRKYPVKEPFVEMLKGSLKTFLNAFTYPDKTMYPVASTNEKDFYNLMDVYLDAVFYPAAIRDESIFLQEGWHYELDEEETELKISGVVYNEMLGAFSNPEQVLMRKIKESLLPETEYAWESGGNPRDISKLSYEEFVDFHKRYYHAGNARIIIYGDLPSSEVLDWLDENYLSGFDPRPRAAEAVQQNPDSLAASHRVPYPVDKEKDEEDKYFFSRNWFVNVGPDSEDAFALDILGQILVDSESAPLKRILMKEGFGRDIYSSYDSSLNQPIFSIVARHGSRDLEEKFGAKVMEILRDTAEKGLDKADIEAVINNYEFHLREADFGSFPKGLVYTMSMAGAWNHGGDPYRIIRYDERLSYVKRALTEPLFEDMIRRYLLENPGGNTLTLVPEKGLQDRENGKFAVELSEKLKGMGSGERQSIRSTVKALRQKQETPDSTEALDSIPRLSVSDIPPEARYYELQTMPAESGGFRFFPIHTNGIVYVRMILPGILPDTGDISWNSLMTSLLTKLGTQKRSFQEIDRDIMTHTGGIYFSYGTQAPWNDPENFYPAVTVHGKVLKDKLPQFIELVGELSLETDLLDRDRLLELIRESRSHLEGALAGAGHVFAELRQTAGLSSRAVFREHAGGLEYYRFLCDLDDNFDQRSEEIMNKLKSVYREAFRRRKPEIFLTCAEEDAASSATLISDLLQKFEVADDVNSGLPVLPLYPHNQGFHIPSDVQYVWKGFRFDGAGKYTGALQVLKTIISLDYLWNRIRVQGGAYGAFCQVSRQGSFVLGSYRDPGLRSSLTAFDALPDYISDLQLSEEDLEKYIIGTIARYDRPLSPMARGSEAASHFMLDLRQEDVQRERDQILNCTLEDLRKLGELIREGFSSANMCVFGGETALKKEETLFSSIQPAL